MLKTWKYVISILLAFVIISTQSSAKQEIQVRLILESIRQLSAQELHDEVYLIVTDLNPNNNILYTVPGYKPYIFVNYFPGPFVKGAMQHHAYWKDINLSLVKNIILWSSKLKNGDQTKIIISLVEEDAPPWYFDDHLGSIKLNLLNNGGHLKYQLVHYSHAKILKHMKTQLGEKYTIKVENGNAIYLLTVKLEFKNIY